MKNKGVTLIELLIVVVVLGIIAAFSVVSVQGIIRNAKLAGIKNDVEAIASAAEFYTIDVGERPYGSLSGAGTCPLWNEDSIDIFINGTRNSTQITNWNGPYMNTWADETPLGGCYVYRSYKVGSQSWALSNWYRYSDDVRLDSIAPTDQDIEFVMIRFYPLTSASSITESREIADYLLKYISSDQVFYVNNQAVIGYYILPR